MEEKTVFQMLQLHSQFEIDKLIKYSDTIEELLHNQIDRIDRKSIENAKNFLLVGHLARGMP